MLSRHRQDRRGFTLLEVLIVVAIIGILASIMIPAFNHVMFKTRRNALITDSKTLFTAFLQYNIDESSYPPQHTPPGEAFVKDSLWPLTRGYLRSPKGILMKLQGQRVTAYDSPDNPTINFDFYAHLIHKSDSTIQLLLADTDQYPGYEGQDLYGIYIMENGGLTCVADRF